MSTTIYLRRTLARPLSVTELDANFSNLQTAVDNKALSGLTDVVIANVSGGQALIYNGTSGKWENTTFSTTVGPGSTYYIQNQNTGAQTGASFWIDGSAKIGTTLQVTGAVTLSNYGAGFVKANATGVLSIDNSTYLTAETDTLQTVTTRGASTSNVITVGGLITNGTISFNSGNATIDPTANLSATASNDLVISTTDVIAIAANTVVLGGNSATRANAQGHVTIQTNSIARVYMPSSNNVGIGVGFDSGSLPSSTHHLKATTATLRLESTSSSVNTSLRVQDTSVAFGIGLRSNELSFFQYPLTSSADNITVTANIMLMGFDASTRKLKLSNDTYSSAGILKMFANGIVDIDTNTYLTGNQNITLTGDVTGGPSATSITTTLANVGTAGTYTKVTTDNKGRVTSASNIGSSDVTGALTYTPVNKAGDTLNGDLVLHSSAPATANSAVPKYYVDAIAQGLVVKPGVRAVATTNVASLSGTQTIDNVSLIATNRVLLTAQSTASQNGPWVVSSGAWTRPTDFDADADVINGAYFLVKEGTVYHDTAWILTTNDTIVVGTTSLAFEQFISASAITAGTGLTKTGNQILIANTAVTAATYGDVGLTPQLTVNGQGQLTAASNITTGFVANVGDGTAGPFTLTHGLNSKRVMVQIYDRTTGDEIKTDIQRATANTVIISGFQSAVTANKYECVIMRVI